MSGAWNSVSSAGRAGPSDWMVEEEKYGVRETFMSSILQRWKEAARDTGFPGSILGGY